MTTNSCYTCAHFHREEESWEMPHIWWYECSARPSMANLKSFPFTNTKCTLFKQFTPRSVSGLELKITTRI